MLSQPLATYFRIFCVIFFICPKRIRPSIVLSNRPEHNPAVRELENANNRTEPGFDFDEDEIKKLKLWKNGDIPYYIDVPSFADKILRDRIRWFLNKVNSETSLNFMELPRPPNDYANQRWVFFINRRSLLNCGDHCIRNFTNRGVQRVVLGYDCISNDSGLADAVLAIAGVPPQHNAPNRDDYIEIIKENIKPEKLYLFKKFEDREWLFHDLVYDFASAGHIDYHKHSSNGRATFRTRVLHTNANIGHTLGFSSNDMLKIRMLYNYITKKTLNKVQKCSKLFATGIESKGLPSNIKNKKARPKPYKYLGIEGEVDTIQINNNSEDGDGEISSKSDSYESYENQEKGNSNINKYDNKDFRGHKVNKSIEVSNNISSDDYTYEVKDDTNSANNACNCKAFKENKSCYDSKEDNTESSWKSESSKSYDSKEQEVFKNDSHNNEDLKGEDNSQSISVQSESKEKFTSVRDIEYKNIIVIPINIQPLKLNTDPLTYLSDYETEEHVPKKLLWKKSGQP